MLRLSPARVLPAPARLSGISNIHPGLYQTKAFQRPSLRRSHLAAVEAVALYTCPKCFKLFDSEGALEQHTEAKHHSQHHSTRHDDLRLDELEAPFGMPGEWLKTQDWVRRSPRGRKSFGAFKCMPCGRTWLSAHSYPRYKQGCKGCDAEYLPIYLWHNDPSSPRDEDDNEDYDDEGEDKPHDSERCEACRAGVCDMAFKRTRSRMLY
eukprot:gene18590-25102_t